MASDAVLMEFAALSRSLGGNYLSFARNGAPGFSSVSIDSRTVQDGSLFVALAGAENDGHRFVHAAFMAGAAAAMVESGKAAEFNLAETARLMQKDLIIVDNTLHGLQAAARIYLEQFPKLLKIGITGSSGKTTTKEIAAAIIGLEKNTVMNRGNFNSETGLPLSVFEVRPHHEAGIFELGMNRRGEIAELAEVLKPNIALVTNTGSAHIGILGSRQAIAEEKKNIFMHMAHNGIALVPEGDTFRDFLAKDIPGIARFYGMNTFSDFASSRSMGLLGTEITLWSGERALFALPGAHNLANAIAAMTIARELDMSSASFKRGLESVKPLFGRGEVLQGRTVLIRDCYNANPDSLEKAIDFCDSLDWQGRRVYVIGDMLELGEDSRSSHEKAGMRLAAGKADKVFFYGAESAAAFDAAKDACKDAGRFFHTADMRELSAALDRYVQHGDLVLLKGSRGCALEQLSSMLLSCPEEPENKMGGDL